MTNRLEISIIIPWNLRAEISEALRQNTRWFQGHQAEILVLNCGGDSRRLKKLLYDLKMQSLRQIDIPASNFNRSLAVNIGLHFTRAPRLFVLGSNDVLTSDLLADAIAFLDSHSFMTVAQIYGLPRPSNWLSPARSQAPCSSSITAVTKRTILRLSWSDGRNIEFESARENLMEGSMAGMRAIAVSKRHMIAIEGYNSSLKGEGWESADLQIRLMRLGTLRHVENGTIRHLMNQRHDRANQLNYSPLTREANFQLLCDRYSSGNFLGTYSQDVATWKRKVTLSVVTGQ
jgi:hypothetical protein